MKTQEQAMSSTAIIAAERNSVKVFVGNTSADKVLEMIEPFIQKEVDKRAANLPTEKVNEIKQNVRIKFWKALQEEGIQYPFAYTKWIIRSVFGELGRDPWCFYVLSYDEYGEVSQGKMLINLSQGWDNPEDIIVQQEAMTERLQAVITAIAKLPMRTRVAMVCSIFERVDDVVQLKQVFESYHVPIDMEQWPDDAVETQRLKALLSSARRKIIQFLHESELILTEDAPSASFISIRQIEQQKK